MTKAKVKPLTKAQLKAIIESKGAWKSIEMRVGFVTEKGVIIEARHGVN